MEGHIYIYGEITSYQGSDADYFGAVNPRMVQDALQANSEATDIIVHINSPGGDVDAGFAIFDILKTSGKDVTTVIEGQCYSIATVIALAGKTRKATQNSEFLIHNPWAMSIGNADDLQKRADEVRKLENKIAEHYAAITEISVDDALEEMKKDTFMELEQAQTYGFITEIVETVKAVAKFNIKNDKMSKETKKEGFWTKFKAAFDALEDTPEVKSIVAKTAEGKDVEFERTEGEIQVGDIATINGEQPDGEMLMANGETYTFDKGKLDAIKEKEVEEEIDVVALVNDAVEAAIKPFKDQLEAKDTVIGELKTQIGKQEKVFNALKAIAPENVIDDKDDKKSTSDKKEVKEVNVLSLSKTQQN